MPKYLHITEYSSMIPYKIPKIKIGEHDLEYNGNIIRTSVDTYREPIKEHFDYLSNDSKIYDKTIPLDNVVIYDEIDMENENQEIAYVFECPVCLEKTITTNSVLESCPHCENNKFAPQVIGLMNVSQMEEIAIEDADVSYYIQVEDGKIIIKSQPEEVREKESIFQ